MRFLLDPITAAEMDFPSKAQHTKKENLVKMKYTILFCIEAVPDQLLASCFAFKKSLHYRSPEFRIDFVHAVGTILIFLSL